MSTFPPHLILDRYVICPARQVHGATTVLSTYHFGKLKAAEHEWGHAFGKHAGRLRFSYLNITAMSETRADARAPGGDCVTSYCLPGLPHHWAEAMLRLLEQHTYGFGPGMAG